KPVVLELPVFTTPIMTEQRVLFTSSKSILLLSTASFAQTMHILVTLVIWLPARFFMYFLEYSSNSEGTSAAICVIFFEASNRLIFFMPLFPATRLFQLSS